MAREIAPSNQWKEKEGARVLPGRLISHPDHAGFLTPADVGTVAAYLVDDPAHTGFVAPDKPSTATAFFINAVGHTGFITVSDTGPAVAYLVDSAQVGFVVGDTAATSATATAELVTNPYDAGFTTADYTPTEDNADASILIMGSSFAVLTE